MKFIDFPKILLLSALCIYLKTACANPQLITYTCPNYIICKNHSCTIPNSYNDVWHYSDNYQTQVPYTYDDGIYAFKQVRAFDNGNNSAYCEYFGATMNLFLAASIPLIYDDSNQNWRSRGYGSANCVSYHNSKRCTMILDNNYG